MSDNNKRRNPVFCQTQTFCYISAPEASPEAGMRLVLVADANRANGYTPTSPQGGSAAPGGM